MKKIVFIMLAVAGLAWTACSTQQHTVPLSDTTKRNDAHDDTPDPNRKKDDVLGRKSLISFHPDSQVVARKNDSLFFIYDEAHLCLYETNEHALYTKIRRWLPEEVTDANSKNCVLLIGTIVDQITLISKEELATNVVIKKIMGFNGLKVYGITGHVHYPNGPPKELLTEVANQNHSQPSKPSQGSVSHQQQDNGRGVAHQ